MGLLALCKLLESAIMLFMKIKNTSGKKNLMRQCAISVDCRLHLSSVQFLYQILAKFATDKTSNSLAEV
jgi:hypothetical protein